MFAAYGGHLLQVFHGYGLSAAGVAGNSVDHHGYLCCAVLGNAGFQLVDIDIAFEGMLFGLGFRHINSAIHRDGFAKFDMPLGGIKMGVTGDDVSFIDGGGKKHVFCSASLMGGQYIGKAHQLVDRGFHLQKAL